LNGLQPKKYCKLHNENKRENVNMARDKEATKQKLIDAVGAVILRDGFSAIGVNAVSKKAGVDKVLIYRYFNDLDGLLKAYVMQKDYFSNMAVITSEFDKFETGDDVIKFAKKIFIGQLRDILENKELQEIILWELNTKNEVTSAVAKEREVQGVSILDGVKKITGKSKVDIPAAVTIILGGIYYIVLRSRQVDVFNGININSEVGWKRIEKSVENLIELTLRDI
jgi:Bacterial regulatory proteins, tetR family